MSEDKLYIVCSAVKYKELIVHGRRHSDAFTTMEKLMRPEDYASIKAEDLTPGFIDQYGNFYDRKSAWKIAESAGQVKYGKGTQEAEIVIRTEDGGWTYKGDPLLISEHLFPDAD
jgi:hypothetical protein